MAKSATRLDDAGKRIVRDSSREKDLAEHGVEAIVEWHEATNQIIVTLSPRDLDYLTSLQPE